jgi:hypothetical protein
MSIDNPILWNVEFFSQIIFINPTHYRVSKNNKSMPKFHYDFYKKNEFLILKLLNIQ